jgi:transcriptional regulator
MYNPKHFEQHDAAVITELIQNFPLAALVTQHDGEIVANHIPFLLEGQIAVGSRLIGHVAKMNPVWESTSPDAESLLIFQGPSAYITPNWYPSKQENHLVVPTYNYAMVHVYGKLVASHDEEVKRAVVEHLTNSMESMRPGPWSVSDAPADYIEKMLGAIVAVGFTVTRIEAKWKVSQNRPASDKQGVAHGLSEQALNEDDQKMSRMVQAGTGIGRKSGT